MSFKLNPTLTAVAVAMAGLVAAGCASQATSDNESVNNAGSGQSDTISQNNPLDAQPGDTMTASGTTSAGMSGDTASAQPAETTAQASPDPAAQGTASGMDSTAAAPAYPSANTAPAYPSTTATAPSQSSIDSTSSTTAMDSSTAAARDTSQYNETALPPRADRN
jgi:hypothetical protein